MEKHTVSLDVFRILCCLGVLTYHVMDGALFSKCGRFLYYGASYCIPGFFLLSGYLFESKCEITAEYVELKISSIFKQFFGWVCAWTVIYFLFFGKLHNPFNEFVSAAVSDGLMPVGWFLFTWSACIFFGYWLKKWTKRNALSFYFCCGILMLILASRKLDFITKSFTQSRWLHLYLTYFMSGMAMKDLLPEDFSKKRAKILFGVCAILFVTASIYYAAKVVKAGTSRAPHQYYGRWYYSIWLFSLFCLVFYIPQKFTRLISFLSKRTFSIYLAHLPILQFIERKYPIQKLSSAIVIWGGVALLSVLCAEAFKRAPFFRKIV